MFRCRLFKVIPKVVSRSKKHTNFFFFTNRRYNNDQKIPEFDVGKPSKSYIRRLTFPFVILFCTAISYKFVTAKKKTKEEEIPETLFNPQQVEITDVVYMNLVHGDEPLGPIMLGLYGNVTPKTVKNFVELAKREEGGYKGSTFHRVVKGFVVQGGDTTKGDGTGGMSIYGPEFEDENFVIPHFVGCVSMANRGPNTNSSQFFITTGETSWLNGKHVVFGRVIDGLDVIQKLENVPVSQNNRPLVPVKIERCGIIPIEEFSSILEKEETVIVPEQKKEKPKPKQFIPTVPQPKR